MNRRTLTSAGIGAFALLTLLAAGVGTASEVAGAFGFGWVLDRRAYDLLSDQPTPADLDEAEGLARRALARSPYNNSARLKLASIEMLRLDRLGPQGVAALEESYVLSPIDYGVAAWRIKLGLEHWQTLTPATRDALRYEALTFSGIQTHNARIEPILASIHDPAGAFAASLLLQDIRTRRISLNTPRE